MITSVIEFIEAIQNDLNKWHPKAKPWFRGESGSELPLLPQIANYTKEQENYFVQSFRRKAGGLANTPPREETDKWLFLAQHYGLPTRLLDWTEGALFALFFAINKKRPNPRVYMLNPFRLNELAIGSTTDYLNYPLSWMPTGYANVALAWEERNKNQGFLLPIAMPAVYQDHRMIAQRSCFTVHGQLLEPMFDILRKKKIELTECLIEYTINSEEKVIDKLINELAVLGVSASTIFPDLDNLAIDLVLEIGNP